MKFVWLTWTIVRAIVLILAAIGLSTVAHCQVLVSMNLMSSKGTAPLIGKGIAAYTWNISACQVGPSAVPFDAVRMNFPEVRLYSLEQQSAILQERIAESLPARIVKWGGRSVEVGGVALQADLALKKSPSQVGTVVTVGGLAIQLALAWAQKDVPKYAIGNPVPAKIDLGAGNCADYTALAVFGKAPVTIGPRRVDLIQIPKGTP